MKCPYKTTQVYVEQPGPLIYEPLDVEDSDGIKGRLHLTNNGRSYTLSEVFTDCIRVECAAWQNGRCVRTA